MEKIKEYLLYPILLFVSVVLLYKGVIDNEFSGLDDQIMIEENWDILTHPSHAYSAFFDDVFGREKGSYYRPIQVLSYIPDAFIINEPKPNPEMFFVINIILFGLNALLVFWFLKLFQFNQGYRLVFTLLYVLHPALTPGVAWIPGRVDIVLSILAILSIGSFIKYIRVKKFGWLLLHFLFFGLDLFNKETSIVIPVISVLSAIYFSDFFKKNNSHFSNIKSFIDSKFWISGFNYAVIWLIKNTIIITVWAVIILVWYFMRKNALADDPFTILGILNQMAFSWMDLIILIGTTVFPLSLQVYLNISIWYLVIALPGLFIFFYLPVKLNTPLKDLFFGYAWFFLFIYPTTITNLINYHRLALPMIGVAFILSPLTNYSIFKNTKVALLTLAYSGLLLFQNLSFQEAFTTPEKYWQNAYEHSPNEPTANNGIAWSYHIKHENDSAYKYYQNVLKCDSFHRFTRISLGLIAEEQGNHELADSLLRSEFQVTYDSSYVYFYIGQIELEREDTLNAVQNLRLGYPVTEYTRNARLYYDTLAIEIKNLMKLEAQD